MGRPRDEIDRRWKSPSVRAADNRWKKIGIPRCNQHDGVAPPHGARASGCGHRRCRQGNSTHPESKTSHRPARRLDLTQTGNSSATCAPKIRPRCAMPGSGTASSIRQFLPERSADPQMLAQRRRTFRHPGKCAHARSRDRCAQRWHLPDASFRWTDDWNALAASQGWRETRQALLRARRTHAGSSHSRRRSRLYLCRNCAIARWVRRALVRRLFAKKINRTRSM